jgi:hypothetical protein
MQNVEYFDKRLILFDNPREEIISSDKKRLIVDASQGMLLQIH